MKHTRTVAEQERKQSATVEQSRANSFRSPDAAATLLAQSSDPLCVLDTDGSYQFVSQPIERVLGYEPAALLGDSVFSYVHPEDCDRVRSQFDTVSENPAATATIEYRFRHADGSWRWIESSATNRLDEPTIEGVILTLHDITEHRQREAELERQNERLEEFANTVAHDIRNPLQVATGRLEQAEQTGDEESFRRATHALDRIETIIDDVLTLAQQGARVTETISADLDSVARDAWRTVETTEITLRTVGDCRVDADPDRLRQLFENLFRNAVEHAGPNVTVTVGPIEPVHTTTRPSGEQASGFYVADDGPGIPDDEKESVLDSGFTTATDGTGFGLAIVARIAEAHGWEVTVTDSHDSGARFEFIDRAETADESERV